MDTSREDDFYETKHRSRDDGDDRTTRYVVALKAFFSIMRIWDVEDFDAKRILGCTDEQFLKWKSDKPGRVPKEIFLRISHVLGIWCGLQIIYSSAHQADKWPSRANAHFNYYTPIQAMCFDLKGVREYIDSYAYGGI